MQNQFNLEKLSQYFASDKKQIKEMVALFLNTIPPDIIQLEVLAEKEDWLELLKITHRIKPSFDVFEMKDILNNIKAIEHIVRNKNPKDNLNNAIQELMENFDEVNSLLLDELTKL